jgi:hypothetical protein
LGVGLIIPLHVGRPTPTPASTRFRRLMQQHFARKADQKHYDRRWQVATVNSMLQGCRCRSGAWMDEKARMLIWLTIPLFHSSPALFPTYTLEYARGNCAKRNWAGGESGPDSGSTESR